MNAQKPCCIRKMLGCQSDLHSDESKLIPKQNVQCGENGAWVNSNSSDYLSICATNNNNNDNNECNKEVESSENQEIESIDYPDTALGNVLREFTSEYENEIHFIKTVEKVADEDSKHVVMDSKEKVLESWIKDVMLQNKHLVNDLEYLDDMEGIAFRASTLYQNLEDDHKALQKKFETANDQLTSLKADNNSLMDLVCRIRDKGVWDVNGLEFEWNTYAKLFGLHPDLPGSKLRSPHKEIHTTLLMEDKIKELGLKMAALKKDNKELANALAEKERTIIMLETKTKGLTYDVQRFQCQYEDCKTTLDETQNKLIEMATKSTSADVKEELSLELKKRDQEIKFLLLDLKEIKQNLTTASCDNDEKDNKIGMSEEMSEMLAMIQTEVKTTQDVLKKVQEKQNQLCTANQIKEYQIKYEDALTLIASKAEIIENLQDKMVETLNKKLKKYETECFSPKVSHKIENADAINTIQENRDSKCEETTDGSSCKENSLPTDKQKQQMHSLKSREERYINCTEPKITEVVIKAPHADRSKETKVPLQIKPCANATEKIAGTKERVGNNDPRLKEKNATMYSRSTKESIPVPTPSKPRSMLPSAERQKIPSAPVERQKIPPAPVERQKIPPAPVERQKIPPAPVERQKIPPALPAERQKILPAPVGRPKILPAPVGRPTILPAPVGRPKILSAPVTVKVKVTSAPTTETGKIVPAPTAGKVKIVPALTAGKGKIAQISLYEKRKVPSASVNEKSKILSDSVNGKNKIPPAIPTNEKKKIPSSSVREKEVISKTTEDCEQRRTDKTEDKLIRSDTTPTLKSRIPIFVTPKITEKDNENMSVTETSTQRSTLNNLLEVAVKGSKQMLLENPNSSFSLIACHSRTHRSNSTTKLATKQNNNSIKSPSLPGILKSGKKKAKSEKALKVGVRFRNRTKVNAAGSSSTASEAITYNKIRTARRKLKSKKDKYNILGTLPHTSPQSSVKKWIENSSSVTSIPFNEETTPRKDTMKSKGSNSVRSTPSTSSRKSLRKRRHATTSSYFTRDPIFSFDEELSAKMPKNKSLDDYYFAESTPPFHCGRKSSGS